MTAFGPIFAQQAEMASHRAPRDTVAALEKKLADALEAAGYEVLNRVNCRAALDQRLWSKAAAAFAEEYPRLQE
jgi:hypothetical protein